METTLIITANVIFLTWLYIHQKRLAAFERDCTQYIKVRDIMDIELIKHVQEHHDTIIQSMMNAATAAKTASESFKAFGESIPKKGFICNGCNLEVYEDYCLKTEGFCYLCDPNIPLEDLLNPDKVFPPSNKQINDVLKNQSE